jgi:hypothetical protein
MPPGGIAGFRVGAQNGAVACGGREWNGVADDAGRGSDRVLR